MALVLELDPPSILEGKYRSDIPSAPRMLYKYLADPPRTVIIDENRYHLHSDETITIPVNLNTSDLCRFLAKVAHGYAIYERGYGSFSDWFLPEIILGKVEGALTYVGGTKSSIVGVRLPGRGIHALEHRINGSYVSVYIQLFRDNGDPSPIYEVVVGKPAIDNI